MSQIESAAAATIVVTSPAGDGLRLEPGRDVVARVMSVSADGGARISLAGQSLDVRMPPGATPGDEIRLSVTRADADGVRFALRGPAVSTTSAAATAAAADPTGDVDGQQGPAPLMAPGGTGAAVVRELARAGVPVTQPLLQAIARVVDRIVADSAGQGAGAAGTDSVAAARSLANLAGRDLALTGAAASRVGTALDLAGKLGRELSALAARSTDIAAALPTAPPGTTALRGILAPNLSSSELAMARIAQASAGTAGAAGAPSAGTPGIASAAATSAASTIGRLDQLALQNTLLGTADLLASRGQTGLLAGTGSAGTIPTALDPARVAVQLALRGESPAGATHPGTGPGSAAQGHGVDRDAPASPAPVASHSDADARARQQLAAHARGAGAATSAAGAGAAAQPTSARLADAVAQLTAQLVRFAPAMATAPQAGDSAASGAHTSNAAEIARQAGRAGAAGLSGASVAGAAASGDTAPLVAAIRTLLGTPGSTADTAAAMRTITSADPATLSAALRQLPEQSVLQLAGRTLDGAASHMGGAVGAGPDIRAAIQAALADIGKALAPDQGELAQLRQALEHAATSDPRAAVQQDASRILQAMDGQQILSRPASGADPGYLYFQLPLPDGRGAEVMVRREPGRRAVSFDEFDIAFLLDTQALGTLMIHLDAHPAGIRADVTTDQPALEAFLGARAEALVDPLQREARRPVIVTTGVFEGGTAPASLLEPKLGLIPGMNEFYA